MFWLSSHGSLDSFVSMTSALYKQPCNIFTFNVWICFWIPIKTYNSKFERSVHQTYILFYRYLDLTIKQIQRGSRQLHSYFRFEILSIFYVSSHKDLSFMVTYFCHHFLDNYVGLSVIYIDLSDHNFDLSEKNHHN